MRNHIMVNQRIDKRTSHLGPLLLLLTASIIVYGRALGHEFLMTWDDSRYVVQNAAVHGFSWEHVRTLFSSYYFGNYAPVQLLSYMLDYEVWGLRAGGFLFTNILIHTLNCLLLYRLFLKLHADQLLATIGAAIFLLHPVQVESVVWISQRKNLLAMFFFLLAWEGYSRYRDAAKGKGLPAYVGSVAALVLALLSKSIAVVFPLVIMAYDYCLSTGNKRAQLLDKLPYILAAGCVAAMAIQSQVPVDDGFGGGMGGGLTEYHGGGVLATFLTMLTVICRYLGLLFWPVNLCAAYAPPIHRSVDITVVGSAFLLIGMVYLSVRLFKHNRLFGMWPIVFIVALLPVSQIVPLITLMNDRYLYFPMMGVAALIGAGAVFLFNKLRTWHKVPLYSLMALPLVLLSIVSFQRVAIWQNDITFWRDTVAGCPTSYTAWEGLGEAYYFSEPSMNEEAIQAYKRALELYPSSVLTLYNLGVLYVEIGDYDNGLELLKKLLFYKNNHVMAWAYLGDIYFQKRNFIEAENAYRQCLAMQPGTMRAVVGLGNLALSRGHTDQARNYYSQIEEKGEYNPEIAFRLACVESRAGRKGEALAWLEKALQRGFNDFKRLRDEKDLSALWEEPRYKTLLQRLFPDLQFETLK